MTNEEAVKILKNEYLCRINIKDGCYPWGCRNCEYSEDKDDVTRAIDYAVQALSNWSASSEQVDGTSVIFPTIHCCRGYDSIQDENGRMGFGVYDPKEKNIYIAGDVPKEIFLKALFHEVFHWVQDVEGMKFDEDDANSFSDILYDAVDMFDDHGPELLGQKTIVEPGEMFVGDKVLKEALDHIAEPDKIVDQFREDTKKTEDVPDIHVGKTDFQPGDKFILELGEERRMFGEFEIKGTDLYVKTDLIEKLRRFDPDYMGEWIFHADWKKLGYAPYECNWCGRAFDYEMNYCGYCGAYMKRKAK